MIIVGYTFSQDIEVPGTREENMMYQKHPGSKLVSIFLESIQEMKTGIDQMIEKELGL